ncbi:PPOX class F420-dependent oxidoreductase [Caldilinea sp.]|uniref:PPOX class F420-dependent oxidoreductase n=1 Tax=Caldilinea sp. TaxID=2293560 RepID=UPI002C101306|nr:PPOX class F420-dependent oxidoreductase [Anaerolineales bacterium]HQY91985.1 PPOX class F420-dependent oxidoreductase [Caldilinea sp.]HRA65997.1 PPOX class F420-dependent oxidoreductase [Caldilinea sp.]
MSEKIPASHVDLLEGPYFAVLTTMAPSGQPENTVVWCSWDGEYVLVNTADGRRKPDNVRKNPKVALTVIDPQNAFRWIDVRGEVASIEPDPDYANINAHAKLYTGNDEYYGSVQPIEARGTEQRIIFKIRPDRVVAFPAV